MTSQARKQKPEQKTEESPPAPVEAKSADKLKAELDAIIDDIDITLEEAEVWIKDWVQKGGE